MNDSRYDYRWPTNDTIRLPLCKPLDMPDGGVPRDRFPDRFDRALVRFTPQFESGEYLIDGNPIEFHVPIGDVFDREVPVAESPGGLVPDCCAASDQLKQHERAPQAVQDHPFCYYVEITWLFDSDAVTGHPADHGEDSE